MGNHSQKLKQVKAERRKDQDAAVAARKKERRNRKRGKA